MLIRLIMVPMSRSRKLLLIFVAVLLVVVLGAALAVQSVLSGSGKQRVLQALSDELGVSIQVATVDVNLSSILQLTPAVTLTQVRLGNPKGFQGPVMVEAESLAAQIELRSMFGKAPRIIALQVNKPLLQLQKNSAGDTNLEVFIDSLQKREAAAAPVAEPSHEEASSLAIEVLRIRGGELRVAGEPLGSWGDINVEVKGFGTGKALETTASANRKGSKRSTLEFTGSLGPFVPSSMPLDGHAELAFAPGELPKDLLRRELGALLAEPGEKALVKLEVTLKGDLTKRVSGPAQLTFSDIQIGRDAQHLLPLNGKAEAQISIQKALSTPEFLVAAQKTALSLAGGTLTTKINVGSARGVIKGSLDGSLQGLDIQQFLGAFVASDPGIQGALQLQRFQFNFAGRDAAQLQDSLSGEGTLEVKNGKLKQMDLLGSITQAISKTGLMNATGSTEFTTLKTNFQVNDRVLTLSSAELEGAGLKVNGGGTVGFDTALNLRLNALVSGKIAGFLGARASGDSQPQSSVPIDITGTTQKPIVRPNIKGLAAEATRNYVGGFLDKLIKKK
jgi:uncharacterized protein involved in outer membrane biogenesis